MKRGPSLVSFLSPERSIIRYVVGTAALTVVIQMVYDGLMARMGLLGAVLLSTFLVILVLIMLWQDYIRRRSPYVDTRIVPIEPIEPHKGVIVLVSSGNKDVPLKIIEHHQKVLEQVWLVSSGESLATADELVQIIHQRWSNLNIHPTTDYVVDDQDPRSTWEMVRRILNETDLKPKDLITDITGGNKLMTAGASLACISPENDMEYVYTPRRREDGTLIEQAKSTPIQISTRWIQQQSAG